MDILGIAAASFLLSGIVHMLVHRVLRSSGRNTFYSLFAYLVGALVLYRYGFTGLKSYTWSAALLYILLSCMAMLFYTALSLGTQLPSSIILASFTGKQQQKFTDLTAHFTDRGLILNRLDDLVQSRLIAKNNGRFILTGKGRAVWSIMEAYRRIFHRTRTG